MLRRDVAKRSFCSKEAGKTWELNTIDFSGPVHFLCAEILKWEVNFLKRKSS